MSPPAHAERCFPSHSPTLRPWIVCVRVTRASYVEELWSPSLVAPSLNSHAKANAICSAISQAGAQRVFLSQAGPRFVLDLLQAGHHLCSLTPIPPPNARRRPDWVALVDAAMPLFLAHTASNEGTAEAVRADAVHPRLRMDRRRHSGGRLGKQRSDVSECQHGRDGMPHRRVHKTSRSRKRLL
jgi:hypothetical protein